jgi:hypothetical protein
MGSSKVDLNGRISVLFHASSFGKEHHLVATVKRVSNLGIHPSEFATAGAVHEQRAGQTGEPAKVRPVFHLALGDENSRDMGHQDEDVEMAEVTAD